MPNQRRCVWCTYAYTGGGTGGEVCRRILHLVYFLQTFTRCGSIVPVRESGLMPLGRSERILLRWTVPGPVAVPMTT